MNFVFRLISCLLSFALLTGVANAQTGVTLKFKKVKPTQLITYERLYDRNNTKTSKSKLRKRSDFTDEEVEEIFGRLDKDELLPKDLNNNGDKTKLQHYVAYELSDFSLMGYDFSLIWIPHEDNLHMPKAMQPPTKDGSIFYTYTKHLSFNGKTKSGDVLAKAGTPIEDVKINVSTADMGQFLYGGSGGRKQINISGLKNNNSELAAQGLKDFDILYNRLQQLDTEYDVEIKKIENQIEKDKKSGVQANLFMKKERATAQSKLDESHKIIKDYLKKYDSVLSEENKETLQGWYDAMPYYTPI